jgi:hypothetical protein
MFYHAHVHPSGTPGPCVSCAGPATLDAAICHDDHLPWGSTMTTRRGGFPMTTHRGGGWASAQRGINTPPSQPPPFPFTCTHQRFAFFTVPTLCANRRLTESGRAGCLALFSCRFSIPEGCPPFFHTVLVSQMGYLPMPSSPKVNEARQRTNKPAPLDLRLVRGFDPPEPPLGPLKKTRDWWDGFWGQPHANLVSEAHFPALERLAYLHDEWERKRRVVRKLRQDLNRGGYTAVGSRGQPVLAPASLQARASRCTAAAARRPRVIAIGARAPCGPMAAIR